MITKLSVSNIAFKGKPDIKITDYTGSLEIAKEVQHSFEALPYNARRIIADRHSEGQGIVILNNVNNINVPGIKGIRAAAFTFDDEKGDSTRGMTVLQKDRLIADRVNSGGAVTHEFGHNINASSRKNNTDQVRFSDLPCFSEAIEQDFASMSKSNSEHHKKFMTRGNADQPNSSPKGRDELFAISYQVSKGQLAYGHEKDICETNFPHALNIVKTITDRFKI